MTAHPDDLLRRADVVAWLRGEHEDFDRAADAIEAGAVPSAAVVDRLVASIPAVASAAFAEAWTEHFTTTDDHGRALSIDDLLDLVPTGGTDTILGVPVRTAPMPDGVVGMLVGARGQRVYIHTDGTTIEAPTRCAAHGLVMCTALGCR
jgi:hypothetical protein